MGSGSHVARAERNMAGMHHKPAAIPRGGQWGISSPEVIATRGAWTLPWKKGPAGASGAAGMDELIAAAASSPLFQASQISRCQEHVTDRAEDMKGAGYGAKVGCGLWGPAIPPQPQRCACFPCFVLGQIRGASLPLHFPLSHQRSPNQ